MPTDEQLGSVTGGLLAWRGLSNLQFKVLQVQGSKVKIPAARLAEFAAAPMDIQDSLDILKARRPGVSVQLGHQKGA